MKKLYIAPRVKNVFVAEEKMICASEQTIAIDGGSAKTEGIKEADSREDMLLGGNSLWDEE